MKSLGRKPTGARLERMQDSPLWAGEGFRNIHPILPGLRDLTGPRVTLSEFLCGGGERRVPRGPLPSSDPLVAWARPPDTGLRATWLGHSTVLIEIDGLRVLTDPVWGPRASPSTLAGPKRFQPVPVALSALPPIDLVLVSHDHYDHLDYPTIRELARLQVPFVTSLGVGAHLEAWGVAPERILVVVAGNPVREAFRLLQRRHRPDERVHDDPPALRHLRPVDARSRRLPPVVGRDPPRPGTRPRGACNARRRRLLAGALGHLQPGAARLGRTRRDLARAGSRRKACGL